jgi:hypothetical protein
MRSSTVGQRVAVRGISDDVPVDHADITGLGFALALKGTTCDEEMAPVVPDADAIKKVERSAPMNKKLFGTRLS